MHPTVIAVISTYVVWLLIVGAVIAAPRIRNVWNTYQLGRANIALYEAYANPRQRAWEVTQYAAEFERVSRERQKVKAEPPRLPGNVVRLNTRAMRRPGSVRFEGPGAA